MKFKIIPFRFILVSAFAAILSLGSMPASAIETSDVEISALAAAPPCGADSVMVHVNIELQVGIWAWRNVGESDLCLDNGGTTEVPLDFLNEPYVADMTFHASRVANLPPGQNAWAFVVTRQDTVNGQPTGSLKSASFVLNAGNSHRIQLNGRYSVQARNLRFTFSY